MNRIALILVAALTTACDPSPDDHDTEAEPTSGGEAETDGTTPTTSSTTDAADDDAGAGELGGELGELCGVLSCDPNAPRCPGDSRCVPLPDGPTCMAACPCFDAGPCAFVVAPTLSLCPPGAPTSCSQPAG